MDFVTFNRLTLLRLHRYFFGWRRFVMVGWWALKLRINAGGDSPRKIAPLYSFVTARLKDSADCRQGWLISYRPLLIQGVSGFVYECHGRPVKVANPPKKRVIRMCNYSYCVVCGELIGLGNDPAICGASRCRISYEIEVAYKRACAAANDGDMQ